MIIDAPEAIDAQEAVATGAVIDADPVFQRRLSGYLALRNVQVVATSTELVRAGALVEAHDCDVLVVGVCDAEGPHAVYCELRRVHKRSPRTASVAIVTRRDPLILDAALAGGAFAVVDRTAELSVIGDAVEKALDQQGCGPSRQGLTRRELQILRLVAAGRSNHQVAKALWVTDQTVKFHLANIYRKLDVGNRFDASLWAVERGLVGGDQDDERKEDEVGAASIQPIGTARAAV